MKDMSDQHKLLAGIIIGLMVAIILGAVAFHAGKNSAQIAEYSSLTRKSTTATSPSATSTPTTTDETAPATLPAGQVKLSGTFGIDPNGLFGDTLCFYTSAAVPGIPAKSFFCFSNQAVAKSALGVNEAGTLGKVACDHISGQAFITISGYEKAVGEGDAPNGAKFVRADKITVPAQCGRGPLNY